jgi:hypothetical protein
MIDLDRFSAPAKTKIMAVLKQIDDVGGPEPSDDELRRIAAEENEIHVKGADAPKDRNGVRQFQGIGSKGHESANHFAGIYRWEGSEAHQRALREFKARDPQRYALLGLPELPRLGS